MTLRVHIDTLVVDDVGGISRHALGAAVQSELQQRLAAAVRRTAWTAGHREHVMGGSFELHNRGGTAALGGQIAEAVHRGIDIVATAQGAQP